MISLRGTGHSCPSGSAPSPSSSARRSTSPGSFSRPTTWLSWTGQRWRPASTPCTTSPACCGRTTARTGARRASCG
uniref:Uncharacterized protein n=1 Tax=Arundo donax TaxID=35708 RepID=A0A0A9AT66_ARUDO